MPRRKRKPWSCRNQAYRKTPQKRIGSDQHRVGVNRKKWSRPEHVSAHGSRGPTRQRHWDETAWLPLEQGQFHCEKRRRTGDANVADMPPATPATSRVLRSALLQRMNCANREPNAPFSASTTVTTGLLSSACDPLEWRPLFRGAHERTVPWITSVRDLSDDCLHIRFRATLSIPRPCFCSCKCSRRNRLTHAARYDGSRAR